LRYLERFVEEGLHSLRQTSDQSERVPEDVQTQNQNIHLLEELQPKKQHHGVRSQFFSSVRLADFESTAEDKPDMGTHGVYWGHMGSIRDTWGHMGSFGDTWGLLGTLGDTWGPLGTHGVY